MLFTDDSEIESLNRQYRGKKKPTDVLSFSQVQDGGSHDCIEANNQLGDIVISLETAMRQAPDYANDQFQEVVRLIIHGLLHLFGFDHENVAPKVRKEMEDLEDLLFSKYRDFPIS